MYKSLAMRTNLLITIILMGLLTIGFTLFTGEVYLKQTLENRRTTFKEVINLEVNHRWDALKNETRSLGLEIQSSDAFKAALASKNKYTVETTLNEHFHRAYVTLGILNLRKIIIYDKQFNLLYKSSEGDTFSDHVCSELKSKILQRKGADRLKPLHQACNINGIPHLVSLAPIGGLRLQGYISIVVNPLSNLAKSEEGLGIPLKIENPDSAVLYQSENWPDDARQKDIMIVRYVNEAGNTTPFLHFNFAIDVTSLNKKLSTTRFSLVSFAILATIIAMLIALGLYKKTIIRPLADISTYLDKIRIDKKHLNETLSISGSKELVDLGNEMNSISNELSRLYTELEEMAFIDSLTGIPNRALLFDRLKQISMHAKRDPEHSEFMLMMMDMNRFKIVNDQLGHNIGDQLLRAVSKRLQKALRKSDTVARFGGDEFAIILYSSSDKDIAIMVAEKITSLMSQLYVIKGHNIDVGMSIGIARYPYDGTNNEEILHHADMAMYHAKRNKLPYVFYDESMN